MKWNTSLYDTQHRFVAKYGEDVVALLAPQEGERILDLGCGTGDLMALIADSGATVRGLDSSEEMISRAKAKYPGLDFDLGSAEDFQYPTPFDAVFSNATLHWVLGKEAAAACIYQALAPGGRFVAEFGGKGNVQGIVQALKDALVNHGQKGRAEKQIWYSPSLGEYASLLEKTGFEVQFATLFERETKLTEESGVIGWLQQFCRPYLEGLSPAEQESILQEVEARLEPTHKKAGVWFADYVRLRISAVKRS